MKRDEIIELFRRYEAYKKGHFILSSGLHSEWYLQCALVLEHPKAAARLCGELAKKFKKGKTDCVVGPALGGIIVAYEVARALGARGIFAEREGAKMILRRGFKISRGERVLVVEDVTTTGGSVKEVIDLVRTAGAELAGVGAIIDRSGGRAKFDAQFKALVKLDIQAYQPQECPLCREGAPAEKPGSRTA